MTPSPATPPRSRRAFVAQRRGHHQARRARPAPPSTTTPAPDVSPHASIPGSLPRRGSCPERGDVKAALLIESEELTVVDDWPEPDLTPESVIVQLTGLGICGSDLAIWSGRRPPAESAMDRRSRRDRTRRSRRRRGLRAHTVGDRVVIEPNYPCQRCRVLPGRSNLDLPEPRHRRHQRSRAFCASVWPCRHSSRGRRRPRSHDEDLVCTEPLAVARSAAQDQWRFAEETAVS